MKSVRIWSFLSPYFLVRIRIEYEEKRLSHRIQPKCGEIRARKTPNTDTFHSVVYSLQMKNKKEISGFS